MSNTKFDDPAEILPVGRYSFTATFRGTIIIEDGEECSLMEAIDESMSRAEIVDWEASKS